MRVVPPHLPKLSSHTIIQPSPSPSMSRDTSTRSTILYWTDPKVTPRYLSCITLLRTLESRLTTTPAPTTYHLVVRTTQRTESTTTTVTSVFSRVYEPKVCPLSQKTTSPTTKVGCTGVPTSTLFENGKDYVGWYKRGATPRGGRREVDL